MKTTFGFFEPNSGTRSFGDFYNLSTNQEPPIGETTSCHPIGIKNFKNINKRWRYCTEEEKWVKETNYSAV
jgi:3-methyladenine DNA glycosylase Mpg